ncbi:bile acid:sodium symporter [Demequina pelophila]|uniref:bile acid:sodium symporter n=1 Tax=Demequina pelophila TaxID=1638984 RepID=UPI0007806915|nr:bile acid:sodium symporter [Demequina pelophila]
MSALVSRVAPFVVALALGIALPAGAWGEHLRVAAVVAMFFLYGARLRPVDVWEGLKHWNLQTATLVATFVIGPLLGVVLHLVPGSVGVALAFVACLPSTASSSVALVGLTRGNSAAAVCAAAFSNTLGLFLAPVALMLVLHVHGAGSLGSLQGVLLHLLLPFIVGLAVQPWLGPWLRGLGRKVAKIDLAAVLVLVYASVSKATGDGIWAAAGPLVILEIAAGCAVLLAALYAITTAMARALRRHGRISLADSPVLVLCGSMKSIAVGAGLAYALLPADVAPVATLAIIVYHQLQAASGVVLASHIALPEPAADATPDATPAPSASPEPTAPREASVPA